MASQDSIQSRSFWEPEAQPLTGCSGTDLDNRAVVVNVVTAMKGGLSHKQLLASHSRSLGRRMGFL